jgi:hypothetical protein
MSHSTPLGTLLLLATMAACAPADPPAAPTVDLAAERAAVDSVLNALHATAAAADWDTYFGLYAPDAVFFGTDATERWDLEEFRGYASASTGWTYDRTERNVFVDADANTAWFDERLRNASYGETRGTGVLMKGNAGWKIVQYNLTIPIPNDLAAEFAQRIMQLEEQQ